MFLLLNFDMTSEQKIALKQKIEQEINNTKAQIEELKVLTQPIKPENSLGRVSRMDAINNKSINDRGLRMAKMKLTKLEMAFEKIDESAFGKCSRCKNNIQEKRLMLLPESTLCVRCAR